MRGTERVETGAGGPGRGARGAVNERQRVVINRLLDGWERFLPASKYATLAACSTDTALRDIRELVERGILERKLGGGRSTSYRVGEGERVRDD